MVNFLNRLTRIAVRAVVLALLAGLAAACVTEQEPTGVAEQAVVICNGLPPAALSSSSPLTSSAVAASALSTSAMPPAALAEIQDPSSSGDLSRTLLRYMVGCAFSAGQTFAFSWTDTGGTVHAESYPGSLGVAPAWAAQPLDLSGQQWVSACLAARLNALGTTVEISVRGPLDALACTEDEEDAYPKPEAAFYGNLFTSSPAVYACADTLPLLPALNLRLCGQSVAGGLVCGPIHTQALPCIDLKLLGILEINVGPCTGQDPTCGFFDSCTPPGCSAAIPPITTFLPLL
jgi:hypothetical protein